MAGADTAELVPVFHPVGNKSGCRRQREEKIPQAANISGRVFMVPVAAPINHKQPKVQGEAA